MLLGLKGIDYRTPIFIININVTFDEYAMFGLIKELDESVGKIDHGADHKVEFEIENSNRMLEKYETRPIHVQDDDSQSIASRKQQAYHVCKLFECC